MTLQRCNAVLSALVAIVTGLLLVAPSAMADQSSSAYKLGGAWVAKVVGVPGHWTYVVAADPSRRTAAGYGSVDSGLRTEVFFGPAFEPSDKMSPILVEIAMTAPDTASYYSVFYGLKTLEAPSPISTEIVYIGVVTGELKFVGPGKAEGTHNFAYYYPTQDADGDGFPDEGETTPYMFQLNTIDTRLPSP